MTGIEGVLADALFPSHILYHATHLNLLQRTDNLRFRVLATAHRPSPFLRPNRIPNWTKKRGSGQSLCLGADLVMRLGK